MRRVLILASSMLAAVLGCAGSDPFPMVQVSGVVKYEDGAVIPADRIVVRFEPVAEALSVHKHPKAATTVVEPSDGSFGELSTFRYGDGVIAGDHRVLVVATPGQNGGGLVPPQYRDVATTPLKVSTDDTPFEFLIPNP